MENKPNNEKSDLDFYTEQGLSRLAKEKLVTIISNLQHMPVELAMKLSEHIPEYLGICKEALDQYVAAHKAMMESEEQNAQRVFEALSSRRRLLEKTISESKTTEERKFCFDELKKVDKEEEDLRARIEKEHSEKIKTFLKGFLPILGLAGGAIGLTVGIGKRRHR